MSELIRKRQNAEKSYKLYRPVSWYRTCGEQLGFRFLPADFDRAAANGGWLGLRRYLPSTDASVSLPFPLSSVVECYVDAAETDETVDPQPAYGAVQ